jgi:hypothetical protein
MIKCLKASRAPIAIVFQSPADGFLCFFRNKRIALYESPSLNTEKCLDIVEALKYYAVIGVVERGHTGFEWGENFCRLAACFYVTGFRPLLLDFIGTPDQAGLQEIVSTLRRSYRLGWVDKPVFTLSREV